MLARGSDQAREVCLALARVCEACEAECSRFAQEEVLARCADVCRRCATACREVAGQMATAA